MGRWENAEISALCFYHVMKNVDKHLEQVRVGRGRLGTHSCSKDQKIVSSSLLTFCLCLEEGFTSFLIFLTFPASLDKNLNIQIAPFLAFLLV